jgi:hypothetical protein
MGPGAPESSSPSRASDGGQIAESLLAGKNAQRPPLRGGPSSAGPASLRPSPSPAGRRKFCGFLWSRLCVCASAGEEEVRDLGGSKRSSAHEAGSEATIRITSPLGRGCRVLAAGEGSA